MRSPIDGLRRRVAESIRGVRCDPDGYADEAFEGALFADLSRFLAERGLLTIGSRVLDVGCGYGGFIGIAATAGASVVGLDIGALEVEIAAARAQGAIVRADAARLPIRSGSVDLVVLLHVLEHVRDVASVVAEAARVVRAGGAVYVVAPNYAATLWEPHYHVPWLPFLPRWLAVRYLRAIGRDVRYLDEIHYTTSRQVVRALHRAGLRLEFPRSRKVLDPSRIRRRSLSRAVSIARFVGLGPLLARVATGPLQSVIEALAWRDA